MPKNMNPEKPFDPSDPQYKKVEDLPRTFRDDFINTEDKTGFVRKEADGHFLEAERKADENIRYGKIEGRSAVDILHGEALRDQVWREEEFKKALERGIFDGFYSSRGLPSEANLTNEYFENQKVDRDFFMRLAKAGVKFNAQGIPNELKDDKEFILELAKHNSEGWELSERLNNDEEFILELAKSTKGYISLSDGILKRCKPEFIMKLVNTGAKFSHFNVGAYLLDNILKNRNDALSYLDGIKKSEIEHPSNLSILYAMAKRFYRDDEIVMALVKKRPQIALVEDLAPNRELTPALLSMLSSMPDDVNAKIAIRYIINREEKFKADFAKELEENIKYNEERGTLRN